MKSDKGTKETKKSGLEVLKRNLFTSGAVVLNTNSTKGNTIFSTRGGYIDTAKKNISQVPQGVQFY